MIIETFLFGPIGLFSDIIRAQELTMEKHENYQKRSYRNAYRVVNPNGILHLFVPLQKGKHEGQKITDVLISYGEDWSKRHKESIRSAYGKAPYFEHYWPYLEELFAKEYPYLFELNLAALTLSFKMLQIKPYLGFTDTYQTRTLSHPTDLRGTIVSKKYNYLDKYKFYQYSQLFEDRHGFIPNLSILDLLFCAGPESLIILKNTKRIVKND